MRKRILGLLLVLGIFFSLSASAWAATYYGITAVTVAPTAALATSYVYRPFNNNKNTGAPMTVTPSYIETAALTASNDTYPLDAKSTWFAVGTDSTYSESTASFSSIDIDGLKIALGSNLSGGVLTEYTDTSGKVEKPNLYILGYPKTAGKKNLLSFCQ